MRSDRSLMLGIALGLALAGAASAAPREESPVLQNGVIGYVMTERVWAVYETKDGKEECPQGFNDGNREEFKKLFPEDGKQRSVVDTQLKREGEQ
ncbi:MAG TPA: hypothetical protein VIU34_17420 [Steroidobacter sp.]